MGFLTTNQLNSIGFKAIGHNVLISDKASIYNPELIQIGSNVRIDDFCLLSGEITLHNYIHISAYSGLYGKFGIELHDYTGLSPRTTVFSGSDDFSGEYMISPMVPIELTNIQGGKVILQKYSQVGSGSIVMPDLKIAEGSIVGAMSFLKTSTEPWGIYHGCPAKFFKKRDKNIIDLSKKLNKFKN
jgi:acetyltransferase-like isoleucine patch superfamily enzyme